MEQVTCYKTRDGKIHHTLKEAQQYAEEKYGNALLHLDRILVGAYDPAHEAMKMNYEWLEMNLPFLLVTINELTALSKDRQIKEESEA